MKRDSFQTIFVYLIHLYTCKNIVYYKTTIWFATYFCFHYKNPYLIYVVLNIFKIIIFLLDYMSLRHRDLPWYIINTQAYLEDIVGSVLDHGNKVSHNLSAG